MASAACSGSDQLLAATEAYPLEFDCRSIRTRLQRDLERSSQPDPGSLAPFARDGAYVAELPSGRVRLSASPLSEGSAPLGWVILVHDLSFLDRREQTARNLLLAAFFVLSICASGFTLLAARLAWRGWTLELRRALSAHDLREASDALAAALRMPVSEQRERMQSMRQLVAEFNFYRWAGRMLIDAAELRRREQLSGRLGTGRHAALRALP